MAPRLNLDHLPQVHELNKAFLELLQARARSQRDCLGLPAGARLALCAAGDAWLESVAQFPRALFRLDLNARGRALDVEPLRSPFDASYHDLCWSILWSARQASRQSSYQARLLFGLAETEIRLLYAMSLADLKKLASEPDILRCAFAEREWLWRKLLSDARPEARRELALAALQPGVEGDWPERRPAQPVA